MVPIKNSSIMEDSMMDEYGMEMHRYCKCLWEFIFPQLPTCAIAAVRLEE